MNYWDKKTIREQLDKKLESLKNFASSMPQQGWIKTIREVLGLSTTQLGKKVGVDQSRISRLEKQSLSEEDKKKALDDMIEKILIDNPKDFWD